MAQIFAKEGVEILLGKVSEYSLMDQVSEVSGYYRTAKALCFYSANNVLQTINKKTVQIRR